MKIASKVLMPLLIVVGSILFVIACGTPIDVDGYCEKWYECCDDVGNDYCKIKGDEALALEQCKINGRAAVAQMTNNKPSICDELLDLYSTYIECLKEADCDKWMGKDYKASDPECESEMEDIDDWEKDHPGQDCGPGGF
ncbi:MAG: hypothetical protein Kow0090_05880 [Myxococcota bacterium]